MSGPFSALSFLKKIPSELLCAYFKRFEEIDLNLFSKGVLKSTELITFWKELPDEVRRTAESDFSLILDMMDELGVQSIESTAQQAGCGASLLKAWDGKTLEEKYSSLFLISRIYGIALAQSLLQIMFLGDIGRGERTFPPI